jgi:hypothetical protein
MPGEAQGNVVRQRAKRHPRDNWTYPRDDWWMTDPKNPDAGNWYRGAGGGNNDSRKKENYDEATHRIKYGE